MAQAKEALVYPGEEQKELVDENELPDEQSSSIIVRPSGCLDILSSTNLSFVFKIPSYVFGSFPLYSFGLASRQNFYLIGLTVVVLRTAMLCQLIWDNHINTASSKAKAQQHPWAYSAAEREQLDAINNDWIGSVVGMDGVNTGIVLFSFQIAFSLLLLALTSCSLTQRMPRRAMQRMSKASKAVNVLGLFVSIYHVFQLLLPMPFIAEMAAHKVGEMQQASLHSTTQRNLLTYYKNIRLQAANASPDSMEPPEPSLLDKMQFNERCCGLRSHEDWVEFAVEEMAPFAEFVAEHPGQLPPHFRHSPPPSCHSMRTGEPHRVACASAIGSRYLASHPKLLPLAVIALLNLVSAFYLQRAYSSQDGLSGLETEAVHLAGDVAAVSSLTGSSEITDMLMNTTVPLVSVPTRAVRSVFEQCPKIGECTGDVAHARLGYNEPLSFEERTTITCSPQFFPLCFSLDTGAVIRLLQFCIRIIWGFLIYTVFVNYFARFYYKSSLGSGSYSRLLMAATLVAFVFPVVVSRRFLLVTLLFIPSLFLDFGSGYIISKIIESMIDGPFQTLMYNLNQTQLSMQCFMMSGSDLAEAGLKLSLKPFVNVAHEFTTSALMLGFLFKKLNASSHELHSQYAGGTDALYSSLKVTNEEMLEKVYKPLGRSSVPANMDVMDAQLSNASSQADEELKRSEEEEEAEDADAIKTMNWRIAKAKSAVKFSRRQYNKFTAALSKAKQKVGPAFKRGIKRFCKLMLFDLINKCNKVGDDLCAKFNAQVPWYMRLVNFLFKIFDCQAIKHSWNKKACERVKPTEFMKKVCIKFARESYPLPGIDGEFINAFSMIEDLINFVDVDFEFNTIVVPFMPSFSADGLFLAMARAAYLLIEVSRLGLLNQIWELVNDMMIGAIIGEIFIFIKRFNSDLAFCNHFVTQHFIEIDYRRKQTIVDPVTRRARDSLLPFAGWEMREQVWIGEEHEDEMIVYPEQLGLTFGERTMIIRKFMADFCMLFFIIALLVTNHLVVLAVDTMNAGLPSNMTFVGTSQLNVTVYGIDINLAKRLTFGLVRDLTQTAVVNTTVELEDCKVTTKHLGEEDLQKVIVLVALKLSMNLLYGYMSRLRPFMCALFYPEQQRRRTVALYNQLLRRRGKRQKEFKDQVLRRILAEKFNREPLGLITRLRLRSPAWNSIFGSLPVMNGNVQCLCCGDTGFEQFKICLECSGSYCKPCWYRLDSMCLLCILLYKRLALDYEDYREQRREALARKASTYSTREEEYPV